MIFGIARFIDNFLKPYIRLVGHQTNRIWELFNMVAPAKTMMSKRVLNQIQHQCL